MLTEKLKLFYRAWKYRYREDPYEIAYLLAAIHPGDTVFDIGAHKGGYTFWMQKAAGKKGKIFAFEPQPVGAALLKKLFPTSNVVIESRALSNVAGSKQLYIMPQSYNVSFEASLENKYAHAEQVTTETTTLDTYCESGNLQPAFIKIDVEGHELQVLEGGRKIFSAFHPTILIEVEERHIGKEKMNAVFAYLQNLDYKGYFFYKARKNLLADFDPLIHQSTEQLSGDQKLYINNFVFEHNK